MTAAQSWQALNKAAPLFSYSLLFQSPKERAVLADLLSLGLEFESILSHSSEPLLALIRLKWWQEQISQKAATSSSSDLNPPSLPLLQRIMAHIDTGQLNTASLLALIEAWHLAAETDTDTHSQKQACWGLLLGLMAEYCKLPGQSELVQNCATALYNSRNGLAQIHPPSAREIHKQLGPSASFLIILSYLAVQGKERDIRSDRLILFKIVWHILKKPTS
jgi:hypothetical protein